MPIQKMKNPEGGEKVSGSLAFSPSSESKGWNRRIEGAQVQELRLFLPILTCGKRKTERDLDLFLPICIVTRKNRKRIKESHQAGFRRRPADVQSD